MLDGQFFYNGTVRKAIAVFGSIFNQIHVGKRLADGSLTSLKRVPLTFASREKFIDRLRQAESDEGKKLAIKLPRMSFEITSLNLDGALKRPASNSRKFTVAGSTIHIREAVPYKLGVQLSIYSRSLDEVLQVLEQIVPLFSPEYTVAVKDMEGPGSVTDVPISLVGVSPQDEYDGDLASSRRSVIYTLDFEMPIRFAQFDLYGDNRQFNKKYIKFVHTHMHSDAAMEHMVDAVHVSLGDPDNDTPESYTTVIEYGLRDDET